jgi:DNA replication protein DnaC
MLIHSQCSMCKTAEWDTEVKPDPALLDDPAYMALYQSVNRILGGCKPLCPDCVTRHALAEIQERVDADKLDAIGREFIRSDTPHCTFQTSRPEIELLNNQAWEAARELVFDARFAGQCSAFMYGPPGTGKTFLARCMLNAAAYERGYPNVMETNARRYIHAVIAGQDKLVWKAQRVFFLLLDDIDKCVWKPETLQILWELLDMRKEGVFTAITSNADPKRFSQMLRDACPGNTSMAEATMGRLNPCVHFEIGGASQRRKTA